MSTQNRSSSRWSIVLAGGDGKRKVAAGVFYTAKESLNFTDISDVTAR